MSPEPEVPQAGSLAHPKVARTELPALAILPFRDRSQAGCERHLCEGLAEELLHFLNEVEDLRVLSRTSTFPLLAKGLGPCEVGRQVGALYILHGQLSGEGAHLVLGAELLEVATGEPLWQAQERLERADILGLLSDLAARMAQALGLEAPTFRAEPVPFEAYDPFLKGRHHYFRFNRQGMTEAIAAFEKAVAAAPEFAPAWAGLALCWAYRFIYVERRQEYREQAHTASTRALALDEGLAEAHVSRGVALAAEGRSEDADAAFEAALQRDPNLYEAYYFYARHCFATDRPMEAIQYFEWAATLRPEDYQAPLLAAQVYAALGLPDEAEAARRRGLARVESRLVEDPGDARVWYMGANALVGIGERDQGLMWARKARTLDPEDGMLLYNLACIHALAGEEEEALGCLEQAVAAGLSEKEWILNDGDLATLRDTPRFRTLVEALG